MVRGGALNVADELAVEAAVRDALAFERGAEHAESNSAPVRILRFTDDDLVVFAAQRRAAKRLARASRIAPHRAEVALRELVDDVRIGEGIRVRFTVISQHVRPRLSARRRVHCASITLMRYTLRGRGAAQCARCGVAILRGEHCFEHTCVDSRTRAILHPECAMDVDTVGFARVLESCRELLPNWASFNELAITRTMGISQRAKAQWTRVSGGYDNDRSAIIEPTRGLDEIDPRWVSPARDARGRPRVRVLCAGSAFSRRRTSATRFDELAPARSWASPKREYVFESLSMDKSLTCDNDPAQPIVATLYAPIATKSAVIEDEDFLQLWRALGFGVSLLWLIGVSSSEPRDAHTLRFRELLVTHALDGDGCPVLCAPKITEAALDRLVRALDEHVDGAELRVREAPWRAMARTLRDDVRDNTVERTTREALKLRLEFAWRTRDPVIAELLTEAAEFALDRDDLDQSAQVLSAGLARDERVYQRWLQRMIEREEVEHPAFAMVLALYRYKRPTAVTEFGLAALRVCKSDREFDSVFDIIMWQANRDEITVFERWVETEAPPERVERAREALAQLRDRWTESESFDFE